MITGDRVAILVGLLAGWMAFAAFGMARWRASTFRTVYAGVIVAGLFSSRVCSAILPNVTEAQNHLLFLTISSAANVLLGSRVVAWIETRRRR